MDASSVAALVAAAAAAVTGGAAGEAGRRAWVSLAALVQRRVGRRTPDPADPDPADPAPANRDPEPEPADPATAPDPADPAAVRALTRQLVDGLRTDGELADALRRWSEEHAAVLHVDRSHTVNRISGNARIGGKAVQIGGDVHGDLTIN